MNNHITDAIVISKEYIAFPQINFVSAALCTDSERFILSNLIVQKKGKITSYSATDGHRLHTAVLDPGLFEDDLDQLDPGLYNLIAKNNKYIVLKKSDDRITDYPEIEKILNGYEIGDPLSHSTHIEDPGKIGEIMIRTNRLMDTTYLTQAIGYGSCHKNSESISISFSQPEEDHTPIIIAHTHGTALVMPIRRPEAAHTPGTEYTPPEESGPATIPFQQLKETLNQ